MTRNRHMSTCNLVGVGYRNHKWNLWAKRQVTFTHHGPEWWYATVPKFPYFFWCIRNAVISLHNKVHIVHLHHHTIHKLLTAHWWINFPHDLSHLAPSQSPASPPPSSDPSEDTVFWYFFKHNLARLKTWCSEASSSITFYRGCIRSTWRHGVLILLQA